MSDGTKSGYTKTSKKVKCINSGRIDLIYKKVYDVFIDVNGDEFVIDEAGDWSYDSMEFPLWCEVFDDTADTTNKVNTTNETKHKFKVGDNTESNYTKTDKKVKSIYDGRADLTYNEVYDVFIDNKGDEFIIDDVGDKRYWSISDDYYELVGDDNNTIENENNPIKSDGSQIVSDGGSSSYYAQQIPKGMLERFNTTGIIEAKDVIRLFLGNDFNMGNIFKAYCRIISLRNGKGKAGIDEQYDLTKAKFFAEDELNYYLENKE